MTARPITLDDHRPLSTIAREIRANWPRPYFGAEPYIGAMSTLSDIKDAYGADSAQSVVLYFLANAQTWRGATAKRIKAELKDIVRANGYRI